MKGHDSLIAMRMQGAKPLAVNIHLGTWPAPRPNAFDLPAHEVFINPADKPNRADLRFLVGLDVFVTGAEGEKQDVVGWCQACVAAGAAQVIGYEESFSEFAKPVGERLLFDSMAA